MTGPRVAVVIAYRDLGCEERARIWDRVQPFYDDLAWQLGARLVIADSEPFTRARALNQAIADLEPDTVVIQADPDSLMIDPAGAFSDRYFEAVEMAASRDGLVVPHNEFRYLTPEATGTLLRWLDGAKTAPTLVAEETGCGVGNCVVFSHRTWAAVGGYEDRFPMWGGDDGAFAYATGTLVAPLRRLRGQILHCWHPRLPDSIPGTEGYVRQFEILERYRDAAGNTVLMRELVGL